MNYKLGENTTRNLESILKSNNPKSKILVDAVKDFINYTPIDFCVIHNGGFRTAETQKILYDNGVSKCDGVEKVSQHQLGLAVDIVPWVYIEKYGKYKPSWGEKESFYLAGAFMSYCKERGLQITCGADWNADGNLKDGWDPIHMQIK